MRVALYYVILNMCDCACVSSTFRQLCIGSETVEQAHLISSLVS